MQDNDSGGLLSPGAGATPGDAGRTKEAEAPLRLKDLPALPRDDLARLWQDLFHRPPPPSMSTALMLRFLSFELQARDRGRLAEGFVAALTREVGGDRPGPKTVSSRLRPGGRLLREWSGTTHVVDITDTGFLWRGARWASLSAIAKEITGAHWSGPRFFGLTAAAGDGGKGGTAGRRAAPVTAASSRAALDGARQSARATTRDTSQSPGGAS